MPVSIDPRTTKSYREVTELKPGTIIQYLHYVDRNEVTEFAVMLEDGAKPKPAFRTRRRRAFACPGRSPTNPAHMTCAHPFRPRGNRHDRQNSSSPDHRLPWGASPHQHLGRRRLRSA
jgi:hypothetical protein